MFFINIMLEKSFYSTQQKVLIPLNGAATVRGGSSPAPLPTLPEDLHDK